MPELPLDDDQRHTLARHLDSVSMPKLMRSEASAHARGEREAPQRRARCCRGQRSALCRALDHAQECPNRHSTADLKPSVYVLPGPGV